MAENRQLTNAKSAKNDEFNTQYADIQKEVNAYLDFNPDTFRGKTVLLPCDDPEWSKFTRFFAENFERLGLKKLISTSYAAASKKMGAGAKKWGAWLGNTGTSWMGWGFSNEGYWEDGELPMYDDTIGLGALYGVPARLSPYTVQQAADATSDQLMADPVFRHNPEAKLVAPNLTRSELDELLAKGFPALSGPAGSRELGAGIDAENQNMNLLKINSAWPRSWEQNFQGWRHSDIKEVALPFVRPVFERIILEAAQ